MSGHVRDSVQLIDDDSWLIGDQFIITRHSPGTSDVNYVWRDTRDGGSLFSVAPAPAQLPITLPLPPNSLFPKRVHLSHDASVAVWSFGDAVLKVSQQAHGSGYEKATREHTTLKWIAKTSPFRTFALPRVLHHAESSGGSRTYLLSTRVPGVSLAKAWREMAEPERAHVVSRVVEICQELSFWTSKAMTGVDGRNLAEPCLSLPPAPSAGLIAAATAPNAPQVLEQNCKTLGLDCTGADFVLAHNGISPDSVMVDRRPGSTRPNVGLTHWDCAGYVPRGWVRTKVVVAGLTINGSSLLADLTVSGEERALQLELQGWRATVAKRLGAQGFPEVVNAWRGWYAERMRKRFVLELPGQVL